jgi:beta-glucosidase
MKLSSREMERGDTLWVSVTVTNTGDMDGAEVVQLYTRDMVGSLTRPVKELKGFRKIPLPKGESNEVRFALTTEDLKFVGGNLAEVAEPGEFRVMTGPDSGHLMEAAFTLIN